MAGVEALDSLTGVDTTINYVANAAPEDGSRWLQYWINNSARTNMESAPHDVVIRDARPIADRLDLDREGFRLVAHKSGVRDYRDPEHVAKYQPREVEELVKDLTGAAKVFGIGPMLRFGEASAENKGRFNSHPARFVHADYVDETIHWLFDLWPDVRVEDYRRFASYNVWRTFTPPPQDIPLAVCDARSVAPGDAVDAMAVMDPQGRPPMRNVTSVYHPNPDHLWYYFRDMTVDEVIVFKQHDSDPARAHRVPHSAFSDPSCPPGVPPRGSAETRILAVFD